MVASKRASRTSTQGHVALYARDARWRKAVGGSLDEAGHSHEGAASPNALGELLARRGVDVLALKVRTEAEGEAVAEALAGVTPPMHTILLGNATSLSMALPRRRGGTFRYVPGPLEPDELVRLIDLTISAGGWDEALGDGDCVSAVEEIDLLELFDETASSFYRRAKRKQLRFSTSFEGPAPFAVADPRRLRQGLSTLLEFAISIAPQRARIAVEGEAAHDDWVIQFRVSNGSRQGAARVAGAVREATKAFGAVARLMKDQGGMFWVDLVGPHSLAFSITLPLPPRLQERSSA